MQRGCVTLQAWVDVADDHDVAKYLEDVRRAFADRFSGMVHEYYPDALVNIRVTVTPVSELREPGQ